MFLAIVFIVLGVFLLLNALGIIISANFWGIFWAILLIALGLRLLIKKGGCPMCDWGMWHKKMSSEDKCCGNDCCGEDHH